MIRPFARYAAAASAVVALATASAVLVPRLSAGARADTQPLSAKQSFDRGLAQQWARDAAEPQAPKTRAAAAHSSATAPPTSCVPPALPVGGGGIVNANQGGPFGSAANFVADSSWSGSLGSTVYAVWAGQTGVASANPGGPALDVYLEQVDASGCGVIFQPVGIYAYPTAAGSLKIVAVSGASLQLGDTAGSTYAFDLTSRRFSA